MIHTNRVVTVGDQESIIDKPIILYRGDREVEVEFELIGNEFMFSTNGNVIKSVNASHGQLVLNTPSGDNMFSELAECHDGKVVFVITKEMIDEFIEIGFYSFQIRLYDGEQMKSRVTIPPVFSGLDIRNPIAAEDETNVVGMAVVDYARIYRDQSNEELPTFDWQGNYIKTDWVHHDVITENKMNKIEDGLWTINNKISTSDNVFLKKAEQLEVQRQNDMNSLNAKDSELSRAITDGDRVNSNAINTLRVDMEVGDTAVKNELNKEISNTNERLTNIIPYLNIKEFDGDNDMEKFLNALEYAKDNQCVLYCKNTAITITQQIVMTASKDLDIRGDNFIINFDLPDEGTNKCGLEITSKNSIKIDKGVTFDFHNTCAQGIHIKCEFTGKFNNKIELNGTFRNCRRAYATGNYGDVVYLRGNFEKVIFDGIFENCAMAPGTGISGSQGVTIITVTTNDRDNLYAKHVVVGDNAVIQNVYSEDPDYTADQDGLRVFGHYKLSRLVVSKNATFKDCAGRFIKSQICNNVIGGNYICENRIHKNGGINTQHGGLRVSNVTYDNLTTASMNGIINVGSYYDDSEKPPCVSISDIQIYSPYATIGSVISTWCRDNTLMANFAINSVTIDGDVDTFFYHGVNGPNNFVSINNVYVKNLTGQLLDVRAGGSLKGFECDVNITNCINAGVNEAHYIKHRVAGNSANANIICSIGNSGFKESSNFYTGGYTDEQGYSHPIAKNRLRNIVGAKNEYGGFNVYPISIAANGTYTLAQHGYGTRKSFFGIMTLTNINGSALFYYNGSALSIIHQEGDICTDSSKRVNLSMNADKQLVITSTYTSALLFTLLIIS